ncbi:NAD-dependent epimerase/dehydratase family protein [Bacillus sp. JJ1562]|uniref:NAD-dependent epimerase/dehydratase family protein n=1 Tax=Bacillus sp. JJ1562 TaxID=3122960 RepID=UPI0030031A6D
MKEILVTGAGGYIGSILVPKLLKKGYKVKAVDRYFFGIDKISEHKNLEVIQEDTRRMKPEYFAGVDAVIDLVAVSNDPSGELFMKATNEINYISRVNTACLAKWLGVKQYILPSSCSLYGFQDKDTIVDEQSPTNPITVYAKANEKAEQHILPLADEDFTVTVLRQATVFGYSPRMRFDLAINGMTYGAWKDGVIPLMRDGSQWRPFVHIEDTTDIMCLLLETDPTLINGQIFNVGSNSNNYQLGNLANEIANALPTDVQIDWYGDPDYRSYRVSFDKIEKLLGWKAKKSGADGAIEIYSKLNSGELTKSEQTITLDWYKDLVKWHKIIKNIEMYGGILDL